MSNHVPKNKSIGEINISLFNAALIIGMLLLVFYFFMFTFSGRPCASSFTLYYGEGCPHCESMMMDLLSYEKSTGCSIKTLEIFNNSENLAALESAFSSRGSASLCSYNSSVVPTLVSENTKNLICGFQGYDNTINFINSNK